ncbi:4Fe-4S domain-containing protein [Sporichthya polymorpha]|uniref:4Fe-4S domain-containing protein n=1 Tax=Sporichthya polymorpha TaxID=35751 RepID=UPI00036FF0C4|nr:ferredoxin [Sporichthya polymorpha]
MARIPEDVQVEVLEDSCMGIGDCRRLMPKVFVEGEEHLSVVAATGEEDFDVEELVEVAYTCPNSAIAVRRDGQNLLS